MSAGTVIQAGQGPGDDLSGPLRVLSFDLATGVAVGGGLRNADNLAIDAAGNMYIIEDRNGGVDNDIWFARDLNKDGDLVAPGLEGSGGARNT